MADYQNHHDTELPPIGQAKIEHIRPFIDCRIPYTAAYRVYQTSRWRRAELYDQGGPGQWIRPAQMAWDIGLASQWQRMPDGDLPMHTYNEGLPIRQNESARLSRPEYVPTIRPNVANPNYQQRMGARKAKQVLTSELKRMGWDKQSDLGHYHMPLYGVWWLKSEWVMRWDDTVTVPVTTAKKCVKPRCDFITATGADQAGKPLTECPQCEPEMGLDEMGQAAPLPQPAVTPFQPTIEEASTMQDSYGRSLGRPLPKGDWQLSVVSPYNVFIKNLGIDVDPTNLDEWVEVSIENIDDLARFYPDKLRDKNGNLLIQPEKPSKLMEYHPVAGSPDVYGRTIGDQKLFYNHVRVKNYYRKPWMEWKKDLLRYEMNRGRYMVIAGDLVLADTEYMIASQSRKGKFIDRCIMEFAPWDLRDGGRCADGIGLWEQMFDAQDGCNNTASQQEAVRERGAVPFYVERSGMNTQTRQINTGVPMRLVTIDTNPLDPSAGLELLNNTTIDQGVVAELNDRREFMSRVSGNAEVENGNVPAGVAAATAISILKEESSEKRRPRIKRIREMLKRVWSHGLELVDGLWLEERPVSYEDATGTEQWTAMKGLDLCEQTNVDLEPEPAFDSADQRRESIRDIVNLLGPPTQWGPAEKLVAKLMDAPPELSEDADIQVEGAQREWIDFEQKRRIPVVDPDLDDPMEHYQQHGRDLQSEEGRELEDRVDWDGALQIIGVDWDESLKQLAMPQMIPAPPDPITGQPALDPMTGMPKMVPMPQTKPLQTRIYEFWSQKLMQASMPQPQVDPMTGQVLGEMPPQYQSPDPQGLNELLQFRAHMQAHKLMAELAAMQAQAGQMQAQAPGGPAASPAAPVAA
jgi:hypothetical protein